MNATELDFEKEVSEQNSREINEFNSEDADDINKESFGEEKEILGYSSDHYKWEMGQALASGNKIW